jgi:dipeptidyl-peptidase 4
MRTNLICAVLALTFAGLSPVAAQQPGAITAADYTHAEKFLAPAVNPLVIGGSVSPNWLPEERFWYRNTTASGFEFILVDAGKRTRLPAFDHAKLAAALSAAANEKHSAGQLPFQSIEFSADGNSVSFDVGTRRWSCDVQGSKCTATGEASGGRAAGAGGRGGGRGGAGGNAAASPNGKRAIFIRDWNLWMRDTATG